MKPTVFAELAKENGKPIIKNQDGVDFYVGEVIVNSKVIDTALIPTHTEKSAIRAFLAQWAENIRNMAESTVNVRYFS